MQEKLLALPRVGGLLSQPGGFEGVGTLCRIRPDHGGPERI